MRVGLNPSPSRTDSSVLPLSYQVIHKELVNFQKLDLDINALHTNFKFQFSFFKREMKYKNCHLLKKFKFETLDFKGIKNL